MRVNPLRRSQVKVKSAFKRKRRRTIEKIPTISFESSNKKYKAETIPQILPNLHRNSSL